MTDLVNREASPRREMAEKNLILISVVGSSAHGLALKGTDDHDLMGVCIEDPEYVIGLKSFEQDVFRTKPEGVRSQAGDTDRVIYSLRKYCRLALSGNPSILILLYAEFDEITTYGSELIKIRDAFAARSAGRAFLGYMTQQRQRLLGERGQMNVKRPELVEAHGYDTKYAGHMLRLGFQGVEYLETGALTLPMLPGVRDYILSVRKGEVDLNDVLTKAGELEQRVKDLLDTSPLPPEPNHEFVGEWLKHAYLNYWEENGKWATGFN